MTTPVLGIPEIAMQQQQPEVTHNTAVLLLQATVYGAKAIQNTPPGSPAAGDVYIVGTSPTGAWAGRANAVAVYYGGWKFLPDRNSAGAVIAMGAAQRGMRIWLNNDGLSPAGGSLVVWTGTSWQLVPGTHIDY